MKKTRKGGVRIVNTYNQTNAIIYFIQNSTFQLFSKAGISGLQVLATLNADIKSPYRTVRTNLFNSEVRQILFKLFKVGSKRGFSGNYKITLVDDVIRETQIQKDLYIKSLYSDNSLLEPICPCVVFSHHNPVTEAVKKYFANANSDVVRDFLQGDVGFIAMEFMEGYKTLESLKHSPQFEIYKLMALYELNRMHQFGYMHNDFHFENVLIHEKYSYFDTNDFGRAIIIDFGLSDKVDEQSNDLETLLREEYGKFPENLFEIFEWFTKNHEVVQNTYISAYETRFNKPIKEIMSFFVIGGGNMSQPIKRLGIVPIQHEWNLPPAKELDKIVKEFFASSLKGNPDAYKRFNDGVNSVLEMERTDPEYLKKLMTAQQNGLLVEPTKYICKTKRNNRHCEKENGIL